MRSFRTAAVAGASALAITLGSTAVASAQTEIGDKADGATVVEHPVATAPEADGPSRSSEINHAFELDGDKPANGVALFGSSREGFSDQPAWARVLYTGTVLGMVGAVFGSIIAPIYNFFVHGL